MKFMTKRGLLLIVIPAVLMVLGMMATTAMEQGEEEARLSELRVVQAAVISMMVENDLRWAPPPRGGAHRRYVGLSGRHHLATDQGPGPAG